MWGRVTPTGVFIPFRLTHATLGRIVGAQRPSVTVALGRLESEGHIGHDRERHFILFGDPPQWDQRAPAVAEVEG